MIAVGVLFGALYLTRAVWLTGIGNLLVRNDRPQKGDVIITLAGDFRGNRILKACELVRQGLAPSVIVSGPMAFYGRNEASLAVDYAASHGCPAASLVPVQFGASSTEEEARHLVPEMEKQGHHRLLIVTSNFHTARAGRIFERMAGQYTKIVMIPAPDPFFSPETWWHTREGQKTVFYEWSKTVAVWLGL